MSRFRSALRGWFLVVWSEVSPEYREYLIFAALGLVSSFSFLWPFAGEFESHYFYQSSISLIPGIVFIFSFGSFFRRIYEKYEEESTVALFLYGFVYWLSYFIGALYWLVYPLTIDLSLHWMLIPFALIAVPAYLSIPLLLPVYAAKKFCKNVWISALVFATLTFLVMYFQGHYAPGFPWALPGYVWSRDVYCMQSLSIWGIYGQTFFTLIVSSFFGIGLYWYKKNSKKCFWSILSVCCLLILLYIFGFTRIFSNSEKFTNYKIRCVQGSILQKNKMNKNLSARNLDLYLNLSRMKSNYDNWSSDFIIWPEASIPYLFTDESVVLRQKLSEIVPIDGYLITGAVRKDSTSGSIYNSVVVLDQFGKNIANYDKKRLVPFGEYIPFRNLIPKVFAPIANSIGDFDIGKGSNIMELKGLRIAFAICYEAIFPGEFVSEDADVIVNVTNDAWFGHTSELVQHLSIVRARSIEEGIPLIRVTNFGISAVFDAYGRKVDFLKTDDVGVIDCYVPKKAGKTFYRKFFVD